MNHASSEKLLWMYESMLVIRRFEDRLLNLLRIAVAQGAETADPCAAP